MAFLLLGVEGGGWGGDEVVLVVWVIGYVLQILKQN